MFRYHLIVLFVLFYFFSLSESYEPCYEDFLLEAQTLVNLTHCKREILGVEFAWTYDNVSRTLQFAAGAQLDRQGMTWLAWGLNPGNKPRMVGTRALIGIKQRDGRLLNNTYNITEGTKRGCVLEPSRIDLNLSNFEFLYMRNTMYYVIRATLVLPHEYNDTRINMVWQVGKKAAGDSPKMHSRTLQNYDSTQTIDLISGLVQSLDARRRNSLRTAHGVLNIAGWGTLLPIGVIIARYFRKNPIEFPLWEICHKSCQILGWCLGFAGWVLGLLLGKASNYYKFPIHGTIGTFIFTFATLQMLALTLKPKAKDDYRHYWNMYHHLLGYSLLAAIGVNIFKGIRILNAEPTWKWYYVGELALFGIIFSIFEVSIWWKFCRPTNNEQNPPATPTNNKQKQEQKDPKCQH